LGSAVRFLIGVWADKQFGALMVTVFENFPKNKNSNIGMSTNLLTH